jgi:hypothetical protein
MRIVNEPDTIDGLRVVQDNEEIAEALRHGETVYHWEAGDSMKPLINHMEYCKIIPMKLPVANKEFIIGKPVFCHFVYKTEQGYQDFYMVHRCTEIYVRDGEQYFKIEGTDGTVFGWTKDVYGWAESTGIFQDEVALWN